MVQDSHDAEKRSTVEVAGGASAVVVGGGGGIVEEDRGLVRSAVSVSEDGGMVFRWKSELRDRAPLKVRAVGGQM